MPKWFVQAVCFLTKKQFYFNILQHFIYFLFNNGLMVQMRMVIMPFIKKINSVRLFERLIF